jgi:DNA-binding Lrp family transcriptional regulator
MAAATNWTDAMDKTVRRMRAQGNSWEKIADDIGVKAETVTRRARNFLELDTARQARPGAGISTKYYKYSSTHPRGTKIHWTQDDIDLVIECRRPPEISYNDIAKIIGVHPKTVTELAKRLGVYKKGEVIKGRGHVPNHLRQAVWSLSE